MDLDRAYEREEDALAERYSDGLMSKREYERELRELRRDYAAAVEEEALDAYNDVLGSYGWET